MTGPPLAQRFAALATRLGATEDVSTLHAELAAAWAEPHRAYHSTAHLVDCLGQLDEAPSDGADRDAAEAALWFHDAVYDPRSSGNEVRSAEWAERALLAAGVGDALAAEVARLVLVTRHLDVPHDPTACLVADVDLSILGRPAPDYEAFEERIRIEYAWVPEAIYRSERTRILRRLLDRQPLYGLAHFRDRYEAAARANLLATIARLTGG